MIEKEKNQNDIQCVFCGTTENLIYSEIIPLKGLADEKIISALHYKCRICQYKLHHTNEKIYIKRNK